MKGQAKVSKPEMAPQVMVPEELVLRAEEPEQVPKFPMVVEPVLPLEKRVVVEKTPCRLVVEAMAKRVVLVLEARLWIERVAHGVVEASPTLPLMGPPRLRTPARVEDAVTERLEVVALAIVRKPPFTAFSMPLTVVDPVMARALLVAPVSDIYPPPTALKKPVMVDDPVTAKLVVVPLVSEKV